MTKKREKNEVEYLRGLVRKLKSENRNLKKQLGKTNKRVIAYEENIDLSEELEPTIEDPTDKPNLCAGCGDPQEVVDLGIKWLIICSTCKVRKTYKK